MRNRLQFAICLAALSLSMALTAPALAQRERANRQQDRPPKQEQRQQKQQQQRAERQERQQENLRRQLDRQPQREAPRNANRPPQQNIDRANSEGRAINPNRPPNAFAPPPRPATPQERQRNEQRFNRLPPQQKQEMRDRQRAWGGLSQDQRERIKNDLAPRYQQLAPDRQRAIRSRLNVLKNMPESARNQHLNDPNFTRGMNEEDKAMLRDLAHMHIGGAPEEPPPNE